MVCRYIRAGGRAVGGIGSGHKPGRKKKEKVTEFRPAKKEEMKPEGRMFSVPAHVGTVKTTSGVRFGG